MVNVFGANPGVAILVGVGLLIIGIASGRYILAAAGGFVVIGSVAHLLSSRRNQSAKGERGEGRGGAGPAGQR